MARSYLRVDGLSPITSLQHKLVYNGSMKYLYLATLLISNLCFARTPKYHYGQVVEWNDSFYGLCTGKLVRVENDEQGSESYEAYNVKCDSGYYSSMETVRQRDITRLIR